MAKKGVSAIVSGMGVGMAILTSLMEKAKKRGLPEESIHRLATPEGDALLDKMIAVLGEATVAAGNIFLLKVNYDLRVEGVVQDGKYDWVNSDISGANFRTNRIGLKEVEIKSFHFKREMRSEQAIVEMRKQGYRPAELHELLAFGAKCHEEYPIMALGSVWRNLDRSYVPSHYCVFGKRRLNRYYFGSDWSVDCRFLAVRES